MTWVTTHEIYVAGFNILQLNHDGSYTRINPVIIPCLQCTTGEGDSYTSIIPKHKGGQDLYIEMLRGNLDRLGIFGPATKQ